MYIVIDATNLGGGGGVTLLKELLGAGTIPCTVEVIAQEKVLRQLPEHPLLIRTGHSLLEKTLLHRVIFQLFFFDRFVPSQAIIFAVSGDYLGRHAPVVGMSQNMLLYEREHWKEIKTLKERLRFRINFYKQKFSFRRSRGIIFISEYARGYIARQLDLAGKKTTIIHHGLSPRFIGMAKKQRPLHTCSVSEPFTFVYVSSVHVYKNQWNVVEAIGILREQGYPVKLNLVGSILYAPAGRRLEEAIRRTDPQGEFITYRDDVPYETIDQFYKTADAIIFASTCENMPNILLESMASGIPVACSNKAPMPEFLKDNGYYFDALDAGSIASALKKLMESPGESECHAVNALAEVSGYSWDKTAEKTYDFLHEIWTDHFLTLKT